MIFAPTIIQNTLPEIAVTAADSGVPAVTYNQIKQSLGSQVYNIDSFYLYSTIKNQLLGVIQYNRYDVSGNIDVSNIVTTLDPYQDQDAIYKELKNYKFSFILNGNSTLATTVLPQAYLILRLFTRRITTNLGNNMNFGEMEDIFKKDFYSKLEGFDYDEGESLRFEDLPPEAQQKVLEIKNISTDINDNVAPVQNHENGLMLLSIAAVGVGLYLLYGKK
jgi:hypothetical protein